MTPPFRRSKPAIRSQYWLQFPENDSFIHITPRDNLAANQARHVTFTPNAANTLYPKYSRPQRPSGTLHPPFVNKGQYVPMLARLTQADQ